VKTRKSIIPCYEDYLNLCRKFKIKDACNKKNELFVFDNLVNFPQLPFGCSLIDYTSGTYLFLSQNTEDILSYSKDDYKPGIIFHYNKMLQQDRKVFNELVFPDILCFLSKIPKTEFEKFRFTFNHRYVGKDGSIRKIIQHSTYHEPNSFGRPLLNRVVYSELPVNYTDEEITLIISDFSNGKGAIPVFRKRYIYPSNFYISKRELEILKLSLTGLSSKHIADKLYLSVHTVKNHKRNMMEKTKTSTISGLIYFALKNRLL
jgi:DNA-binding CsgD family transcriptional regulator